MTRQQHAIARSRRELAVRKEDRRKEYQAALHPPREYVTREEFEKIVREATERNKATMSPEMVDRWAHKMYLIA